MAYAAIAAASLTAAAPTAARAALMLSYSETDLTTNVTTTGTFSDNGPGDTNLALGTLLLPANFAPIAGFVVNGSTHIATGNPSNPGTPDTLTSGSSTVVNNSADPIRTVVAVSATNFSPAALLALTTGSGTFTGNAGDGITLKWYNDPTDAQGATSATDTPGTRLNTYTFTSVGPADSFSSNGGTVAVNDTGPFSMTLQFDFTLLPGASLTARGQAETTEVPEPGSLLLFGASLAGLGFVRSRKVA